MLVYFKKDGELKVAQAILGAEGTEVMINDTELSWMPGEHASFVDKLEDNQIFVSGNASVTGNGIFPDIIFSNITGIESNNPDAKPDCIAPYDGKPLKPQYDKYTMKYPPGNHYHEAYEKISSSMSISAQNDEGLIVAQGSISKYQEEELRKGGNIIDDNSFIVTREEYDMLHGQYLYQKDMYIDKHELYVDPSFKIESSLDDPALEDTSNTPKP